VVLTIQKNKSKKVQQFVQQVQQQQAATGISAKAKVRNPETPCSSSETK
jgi:hypothetical protein